MQFKKGLEHSHNMNGVLLKNYDGLLSKASKMETLSNLGSAPVHAIVHPDLPIIIYDNYLDVTKNELLERLSIY
jgi:hypothetical protein